MKPNTLTEMSNLNPGDVFCFEPGGPEFLKVNGPQIRKNKKLYQCHAVSLSNGIIPVAVKEKREVIFLKKSKAGINPAIENL